MKQIRRYQVTPALDTNAYASGDQVSAIQAVRVLSASRVGGVIKLITVKDNVLQKSGLDLFFFDRSVTVANDNAAASFSDADMVFCLGVVNVTSADYDDNAANSFATVAVDFPAIASDAGATIYMAIVARGAPTYAATSLVISITAEIEE
jgi:hypothetical protein